VLIAVVVRLAAIALYGPSTLRFGDAVSYLDTASDLCRTGHYSWQSNLPFFRAPGLPFFIALATGCGPDRVPAVKVALVALDAATVAVAYALARGLSFGTPAALAGAALVAIHPFFVQSSADVTTEPLATLLVAIWLAAVVWAARDGSRRLVLWSAAGAAAGFAALTRPAAILCVPLGIAGRLLLDRRGPRGLAADAACFAAAAAIVVAPWSIVASRAAGGFVLVNDAGGYALWRGMHPMLARATEERDPARFLAESDRFEREVSPHAAADVDRRASTPRARSDEWTRLAIEDAKAEPWLAARYLVRKARVYWRPWVDRSISPGWLVAASAAVLVPVLLGGLLGLARLARADRGAAVFLALVLMVPWIAQLPYQVMSRFRVPFSEVPLCVLAAAYGWSLWERARSPARRTGPGRM